eukprot:5409797-Prorocentrum_lima.AAC.1
MDAVETDRINVSSCYVSIFACVPPGGKTCLSDGIFPLILPLACVRAFFWFWFCASCLVGSKEVPTLNQQTAINLKV